MTQLLQRPDGDDARPKAPPTNEEQRQALQRMLLVVAAGVLAAIATHTTKTVAVIVAVMAMIMLHEFGHFTMAKRAGMKVTEFFLGFGPRLWSVRRGETEYGVKAVVLAGGYVRILGMSNLEDVDPADEPRTYRAQSYPKRISVVVAGSVMHFIIAFLLLFVLNSVVGVIHPERTGADVREIIRFDGGAPSPAERAGLRIDDRVLRVDGREVTKPSTLTGYIRQHPDEPIDLDLLRDGRVQRVTVEPVDASSVRVKGKRVTGDHVGFVGVSVGEPYRVDKANPAVALGRAGRDLGRVSWLSVRGLADLVSFHGIRSYGDQLTGKTPPGDPGEQPRLLSPVGLVRVASQAADSGLREVLFLLVAINIFVGILNMAPLLPFDGGHVAIATYERLRSRKGKRYQVDVAKLMPITYAVVMLFVFVAITALYLDITKPLKF
ncbi:MAG: RIP metalloprotease [Actinobacteria bacterium]|nr:RIP metalloprotease [Actinomycetota bacterium]